MSDDLKNNSNKKGQLENDSSVDPSSTSHIGKKVEQGIVDLKKGISEQASEWEDLQERFPEDQTKNLEQKEKYIKNPSPEENYSSD